LHSLGFPHVDGTANTAVPLLLESQITEVDAQGVEDACESVLAVTLVTLGVSVVATSI
jgi:hypothetical protein